MDAGNYEIVDQETTTATIAPKGLVVSGITAGGKDYDGNTIAAVDAFFATLDGLISGDELAIDTVNGTFEDKNAADGKTVNLSTTYAGADLGNYDITDQATTSASIAKLVVEVEGVTGVDRTYDATRIAGLTGTATIDEIAGDDLRVVGVGKGLFDDSNVGNDKTVSVGGFELAGADSLNYEIRQPTNVTANVTPAALTVTANDDARFVTQADPTDFAGVRFDGFRGVDGTEQLTGTASVVRDRTVGDELAGQYAGVLRASGLDSLNYDLTYQAGDFQIIPAEQLLIRVTDGSSTFGEQFEANLTSAQYLDSGNVIQDLSITSLGNNRYSVTDTAGGSAGFEIGLIDPTRSTGGHVRVGSYGFNVQNATQTGGNFRGPIAVVGSHSIGRSGIGIGASGVNKVYDGTSSMTNLLLNLNGTRAGDWLNINGVGNFSSRNAGTNLGYNVANLQLGGADSNNYFLTGGATLAGSDGIITPRPVAITAESISKVYDGNAIGSATTDYIDSLNAALVGGDIAQSLSLSFDDKDVGIGKTVRAADLIVNDGNGGLNYDFSYQDSTSGIITRLDSVRWIGGNTGNWNDPSNWAGGAIPDLANVANVVVPADVDVTFDATTPGPVQLDSLAGGDLSQTGGTLLVRDSVSLGGLNQSGGVLSADTLTVDRFDQTGGTVTTTGDFRVTEHFSQFGNVSVSAGGNVSVTQRTGRLDLVNLIAGGNASIETLDGPMQLGNLDVGGDLTLNSSDDIEQRPGDGIIVRGTSTIAAGGDITLEGTGNDFVGPVNLKGENISIHDHAGGLILNDVDARGALEAVAAEGDLTQTAGGRVSVVGETTLAAKGDVVLNNDQNRLGGGVNVLAENATLRQGGGDLVLGLIQIFCQFIVEVLDGDLRQQPGGQLETGCDASLLASGSINLPNESNRFGGTVTVDGRGVNVRSGQAFRLSRTGNALAANFTEVLASSVNDVFVRPQRVAQIDSSAKVVSVVPTNGWYQRFTDFLRDLASRDPLAADGGDGGDGNALTAGDVVRQDGEVSLVKRLR